MSDAPSIAIEQVIAAAIENNGGLLTIPAELLRKSRAGLVIAIDYSDKNMEVYFTLVDEDDVAYDDV